MSIEKLQNLISKISVPPIQKQLFADVLQNSCFWCYALFTGNHTLCWSLFLINFIKKRLQHRFFPVNIAKYLRKAFFSFFLFFFFFLLQDFTTTFRNYWEHLSVIFLTLTHPSKRLREAVVCRCFSKKVFANFCKFLRKHLSWSHFLI